MAAAIGGELRAWHKVTLDFLGPRTGEAAARNPFTDYRLDVTFTNGATTLVVPGYFAADGRAADSGATSGEVWRAHFAPPAAGDWTWTASFRTGGDVAASADPDAGASAGFFDGEAGAFAVLPTDKTGADFRGKGMLEYAGDNHYRFSGTGERFLKGGTGSPENLLAYAGFDGTVASHAYAPHLRDWQAGDPSWAGGRGKGLVGAVNYLASQGVNAAYFLTMNIEGDGDDVSPWTSPADRTRYDVSRLDQWGMVFDHMTRRGVMPHVVHQEQENDQLLDGGALGVERKVYYRELIARFGHAPALQWNLGEENTNTAAQRRAFAEFVKAVDPYDHPVVAHTHTMGQERVYRDLLGDAGVDGASLQTVDAHGQTIRWLDASEAAGHPWVVAMDEVVFLNPDGTQDHATGAAPDAVDPGHDAIRKGFLWANLMAGGAGVEWYFAKYEGDGDLTAESFRTREAVWGQTGVALGFFRAHLPFWDMRHADALTAAAGDYVLAKPGEVYAVYLPAGGTTTLDLSGQHGTFEVRWYDPRTGGALQEGTVRSVAGGGAAALGRAPRDPGEDWAVLVRRTGGGGDPDPVVLDGGTALAGGLGAQRWGGVAVSAQGWDGAAASVTQGADGLGVRGGRYPGQLDHDPATGASEVLRLDLGGTADAATLRLGRMNPSEGGRRGETAAWRAFDAGGAPVGEGVLDGNGGTAVGDRAREFTIDPEGDFTRIELSALPYGNGAGLEPADDSSDVALLRLSFVPADTAA